jgi:hypothetical protein
MSTADAQHVDPEEQREPVPPVGNEIHLPGPSLQPLLLTVGITLALVGLTSFPVMLWGGLVLTVVVLVMWIADTRKEIAHLPLHDDHGPSTH